ncbi:Pre-mRNA-splicing factor SPF27 [Balamuthia mandrillaris]
MPRTKTAARKRKRTEVAEEEGENGTEQVTKHTQEEEEEEEEAEQEQQESRSVAADESGPAGPDLIDALPYADPFQEEERALALQLIEAEMRRFSPRDYLSHLPPSVEPTFGGSEILQAEYKRVASGLKMQPLDTQRYQVPKPSDLNDPQQWRKAIANAEAQLEHQNQRLTNLNLLSQYGANAWLVHNGQVEGLQRRLQQQIAAVRQEINEVNRQRKTEQDGASAKLSHLEMQWHELSHKNIHIDLACQQMEKEIEQLKQQQTQATSSS